MINDFYNDYIVMMMKCEMFLKKKHGDTVNFLDIKCAFRVIEIIPHFDHIMVKLEVKGIAFDYETTTFSRIEWSEL